MSDAILVLNAGSSSVKFAVYGALEFPGPADLMCEGACEGIGHAVRFAANDRAGASLVDESLGDGMTHEDVLAALLDWIERHFADDRLVAVGHRVVHGGSRFTGSVRIDAAVIAELTKLIPLAPLHQPHHLAAIAAIAKLYPALPQFACFDTAFHHTVPAVAAEFALPQRLTAAGIRRYGFHGLSYEYIASVLPETLREAPYERVVVAHLGSGASMCALSDRKSIATTMSFTALDGLPMGRRCGNLDPGVVLYLVQQMSMSPSDVSDLLYNECGLYGVSGISDDMRTLLASGAESAEFAIDLFAYRIACELGFLTAALGGIDAFVFTAGIGEHAPEVRRRVCERAGWLGVDLDKTANDAGGPLITLPGSRVPAWVIPTDEDLMIARHVWTLAN